MMRTLKITLTYDGRPFAGWQRQAGRRTVQGELERAFEALTGQSVAVIGSGRTDAGVHALAQVASASTDCRLTLDVMARSLNAHLPPEVAVLDIEEAGPDFHARRDAIGKRYRYQIHDAPVRNVFRLATAWHVYRRLDDLAMHRAGQALVGRHDFSSYQTSGAARISAVRTIRELSVHRAEQDLLVVEIEADGFLYNMVRAIVGTLVLVGHHRRAEAWPGGVLAARDRREAGPTAPAHGLFLAEVRYGT